MTSLCMSWWDRGSRTPSPYKRHLDPCHRLRIHALLTGTSETEVSYGTTESWPLGSTSSQCPVPHCPESPPDPGFPFRVVITSAHLPSNVSVETGHPYPTSLRRRSRITTDQSRHWVLGPPKYYHQVSILSQRSPTHLVVIVPGHYRLSSALCPGSHSTSRRVEPVYTTPRHHKSKV